MEQSLKVSIVTTAYNVEEYIKKCLDSVLGQTYKNIEVIVVNDCSIDNTSDILKSFNDERLKVINHKRNMGAGQARKTGIEASTGDYVITIDGDDAKDFDDAVEQALWLEHGNRHSAHIHSKNIDHITKYAKAIDTAILVKNAPSYAGIGAGGDVDGQVLVLHDMLGMTKGFSPRFLRRYADLNTIINEAVSHYVEDVKSCDFPNKNEQY